MNGSNEPFYFSGHGLKDDQGELYLATTNTKRKLLEATAVSSSFIKKRMELTRARQQVILLDCCYSGAFPRGWISRADKTIHSGESFKARARGQVILTASDDMQYAWEGEELTAITEPRGASNMSVFSRAVVEGIETGTADLHNDGFVSAEELCDYVINRVRTEAPGQSPKSWFLDQEGKIIVSANPNLISSKLPNDVENLLRSEKVAYRCAAVFELERLLRSEDPTTVTIARKALTELANDDSNRVSSAARAVLEPQTGTGKRETETQKSHELEARPPTAAADQYTSTEDRQSVVPGALPSPSPPPTVIVLSPKGGERWETETCHAISWKAIPGNSETKVKRIDLKLLKDETMLESIAGEDTRLDGERQSFDWTLPGTLKPGDNYKLKVIAWDDRGQPGHSFSNGGFSVVPKSAPNDQAPGAIPGEKDPWWLYSNSTHRLLLLYALYNLVCGIWFVVTHM